MNEFKFQGEVTRRPQTTPTLRELSDYLYFRDNPAGTNREWWYHRLGCKLWFIAERDTQTNRVTGTEIPRSAGGIRPLGALPEPPTAA